MYQTMKEPGTPTGLNSISPTGVQVGMGAKPAPCNKDFEQGSVKVTNNPLTWKFKARDFFRCG